MAPPVTDFTALNIPLEHLTVPSTDFQTMVVSTRDNLPGYFESDRLDTIIIPWGWEIHFDIIIEMRSQECWEDVSSLCTAAVELTEIGAEFAASWNQTAEECFGEHSSKDLTLELKLKDRVAVEWNEKMAKLRREVEKKHRMFIAEVLGEGLEYKMKDCFQVHQNLGIDGDGENWWSKTVELLLKQAEEWISVAFTLETWLEDFATLIESSNNFEQVEIFADVLCASYEQAEGMKSKKELVYLLKDGKLRKKGNMTWVSTELGHVTKA